MEITDWVQAIASVVTIAVIFFIAWYSTRMQKNFIEREEAFRVKPILIFVGAQYDKNDILLLHVRNWGRGLARDVRLKVAIDTWVSEIEGKFNSIEPFNHPTGISRELDTRIKKGDIESECKGEIIIWGTMKDEEDTGISIRRQLISVKHLQQKF